MMFAELAAERLRLESLSAGAMPKPQPHHNPFMAAPLRQPFSPLSLSNFVLPSKVCPLFWNSLTSAFSVYVESCAGLASASVPTLVPHIPPGAVEVLPEALRVPHPQQSDQQPRPQVLLGFPARQVSLRRRWRRGQLASVTQRGGELKEPKRFVGISRRQGAIVGTSERQISEGRRRSDLSRRPLGGKKMDDLMPQPGNC